MVSYCKGSVLISQRPSPFVVLNGTRATFYKGSALQSPISMKLLLSTPSAMIGSTYMQVKENGNEEINFMKKQTMRA